MVTDLFTVGLKYKKPSGFFILLYCYWANTLSLLMIFNPVNDKNSKYKRKTPDP